MSITKKLVLVLGPIVLLSTSLHIRTAFGDIPLEPINVSYAISSTVNYDGSNGMIDFDVNVTLECEITYNCSVEGQIQPPTETKPATCYLGVSPYSGTLTVDYHIDRPFMSDLDGKRSIPLPQGGQELLGDSPPIEIPIDSVGTLVIIVHGHLLGDVSIASTLHISLEWSTWETHEFDVLCNTPTALLTMETAYNVYFTVTVSLVGFDVASKDSTAKQVSGNPSVEFVIPEFPTMLILPLFMIATLLTVIIYRIKHTP